MKFTFVEIVESSTGSLDFFLLPKISQKIVPCSKKRGNCIFVCYENSLSSKTQLDKKLNKNDVLHMVGTPRRSGQVPQKLRYPILQSKYPLQAEAAAQTYSVKKVFLKISQNSTLLKKRLAQVFPVNFAKFLRRPFLQNCSGGCICLGFAPLHLVLK